MAENPASTIGGEAEPAVAPVQLRLAEPPLLVRIAYPATAVAIAVVVWAVVVHALDIPSYIMPTPEAVAVAFVEKIRLMAFHSVATIHATLAGLSLSIVIGVPFAVMLVWSRTLERAIMPLLVFSQCFPKVAIGPILIVWFGWGILPKVMISFVIAFFPIVIQTVLGLKSVEQEEVDLIKTMSANKLQVFTRIRIPNALPYFFGGLKVSVTLSLIGAIVGEFIGADRGLGYLLQFANTELQTELLFATMVFLMGVGGSLFLAVLWLERMLIPWHAAVRGDRQVGVAERTSMETG